MRCDETDMTWLGQMTDFTDVYATVSGKEFLITEEGYSGKKYTSGDYWMLGSYAAHLNSFAVKMYGAVLGQDAVEIVSWS